MSRGFPRTATTRNLLAGFVLVTALPVAALVWLGFELDSQDRQLKTQREAERRELAAGRVVSALEQLLAATERELGREAPATGGAIRVRLHNGQVEVQPPAGIPYYPAPPPLPEAPPATFEAAENLEFRQGDTAGAIAALRSLTSSPDPAVRAGALLRLARNLRKTGRIDDALAAYQQLAQSTGAAVDGVPADLAARRARSALLHEAGRSAESSQESARLQADLRQGRWRLDRAAYLHFAAEPPDASRAALAAAVDWLCSRQHQLPAAGRSVLVAEGRPVTLVWHKSAAGLDALAALPAYQNAVWFAQLPAVEGHVTLTVPSGQAVYGSDAGRAPKALRLASETGLPWNVAVTTMPGTEGAFTARRRLLLAGSIALVFLLAAGAYFIGRAVAREMAVMRLQSDFVAAVSHEFRTPLTSMRQFTELLMQDQEPAAEKRRKFYQAQARATERLRRLIESLLDFARMEAGRHPYQLQPLDAAELVEGVVGQFRPEIEARGFTVEWTGGDAPIRISADPDALSRALYNLLDNAAKYSGESRWIGVELERSGGRALIHVRDRGSGVATAERDRIFEKFVRGARAGQDGIKGTGIGLAMVRHIVEAHAGAIEVESEPGRGSTFTISVPAED